MQPYISFFKFEIPSYGLMIALGIIVANIIGGIVIKKEKLDINDFILIEAYLFLSGTIGAKFLYLLIAKDSIEWSKIFDLNYFHSLIESGFVFYGGVIGGILIIPFIKKIHKIKVEKYLKKSIFMLPLIHAFGRVGCFLAGCCYGIPYCGCFNVVFPKNSFAPQGINLFPIQLCEAFFLILLSFFLLYLTLKNKSRYMVLIYLFCYSIIRFILEFLRYDSARGKVLFFSTSQWISLIILIYTIIYFSKHRLFSKNRLRQI
ncbi:prolipoprotein diacylglyceryl transferase [Treponema denticola]|uniref:prolipoprotein diacylglyceryl transferase n=1 Tax=Treponema denticola TaxID=158 RepID=UPI0020A51A23|nr:prolipoprotein diacylglyceryl transferase family protein [Treponema denticola]UTD13812.1 prolipoprotein diacylglyceryl transferase [Treponema denticola]